MDGVMTTEDIALQLGNLGVPYLYVHKAGFRKGGIKRNPQKCWHMAVLDDESAMTDEVLELVYEDLNYLTVVTDRAEHFESMADEVYEETGLLIHFARQIPPDANILLYMKDAI